MVVEVGLAILLGAVVGWALVFGSEGEDEEDEKMETKLTPLYRPAIVAVLLGVVEGGEDEYGAIVIRRSSTDDTHPNELCLPGGGVEPGEDWRDAAARELFEEAGITVRASDIELVTVKTNTDKSVLLIFGMVDLGKAARLPVFVPNLEASERLVAFKSVTLCFPTHQSVLDDFLEEVEML